MKYFYIAVAIIFIIVITFFIRTRYKQNIKVHSTILKPVNLYIGPLADLRIKTMRNRSYLGSKIIVEQTLLDGSNYHQYIASYISDGLKIYGLLTVPSGQKPVGGWPVIIFNHGYIPPEQYRTTERYIAYVDSLASSGYIVFKPDYRGNGSSQGDSQTSYYSPAYTVDVLNALASLEKYPDANKNRIGMWGHSMGGNITLRSLVISKDIKVAVIWGGVVGSYTDIMYNWHKGGDSSVTNPQHISRLKLLVSFLGDPVHNPTIWDSIDPTMYTNDITAPVQLHHGLSDTEVPPQFSEELKNNLVAHHKHAELYEYPGADHNISQSFTLAMTRTISFFDIYLK